MNESLTGWKNVYTLYPISQNEINLDVSKLGLKSNFENYFEFIL